MPDLRSVIDTFACWKHTKVPNGLTKLVEDLETRTRMKEVNDETFQSENLYAVRYSCEIRKRNASLVQYSIGYFVERPYFGKDGHPKSKSKRFEPQLLLSYSYENGSLKNCGLVIVSLLDRKEDGSHLSCLNRYLKKKPYSIVKMNDEDVKTIYTTAKRQHFLDLTGK